MPDQFCHLHVHSEYSLLDGVIRIPQLVGHCRANNMNAVALTDHGNMYGAIEFLEACHAQDVKPIIGCEVYVAPGSRRDRKQEDRENQGHLVLLVLDETGYRNLSTLVSKAYREGLYYKPRVDHELLSEYSDGLVAMSACFKGHVPQGVMSNDPSRGKKAAGFYKDTFKDRFFIELQNHGLPDQPELNKRLVELAHELDIPLVASNDCHFLTPDDRFIQDVMICIQTGKKLADLDRFHAYTPNHYVKSPEEMARLFSWIPEAVTNTVKIADMVGFRPNLNAFHFPEFIPQDGTSAEDYLRREALKGMISRIEGASENYRERLEYELKVICDMKFASYFLIVADFVEWAKKQDIPVGPGRGSAAGCLVSYSLGITDIDPIKYGLQFERFLNPARKSLPDIDMDFEPNGRGAIINYVVQTYGEEHVCQIITFNRLKARAAIRDVGRVMDIPLTEVDKMAKLVPWGKDLDACLKDPDFLKGYQVSDVTRQWIDTAKGVENFTRNASIHAAGVVICRDPIWYHAPVQVMEGETMSVCMYSMNDAEKVGLVKMDFLGLRTLTYLRETCDNIKKTKNIAVDLLKIPLDDSATFKMLASGDVAGVFQLESGGMRDLVMSINVDNLEDLIACIALFRPGPMENDLHHAYARRKNGKEAITFKNDALKPILGPTYGILTYQEQISSILQALGDIDLGQATLVIKLISKKKDRTAIAKYKEAFIKGAVKKGVNKKIAEEIWGEMEAFAGYGFNRAHSAAYGVVAYQTAYLKANYPLEFFAAYFTSEMHNQEKIGWIIEEVKRRGIPVLHPDVNKSRARFTVEGDGIRFGLAAIKGVGSQAVDSIVEAREKQGPYKDLYQLVARIDLHLVNKTVLEGLISAGACDGLSGTRKAMMEAIPDAIEHGKRRQEDTQRGQSSLFGSAEVDSGPTLIGTQEYPMKDFLRMEKETLGFYLSHHPLEDVWGKLQHNVREKISDLAEMRDGRTVRVGGMLGSVNRRLSKKLQNFALFNLEDLSGRINGILFPQAYEKYGPLMETGAFVVIKGRLRVEEKEGVASGGDEEDSGPRRDLQLIVEEIWRLDPDAEDEKATFVVQPQKADVTIDEDIMLAEDTSLINDPVLTDADYLVSIVLNLQEISQSGISEIRSKLQSRKGPTPVNLKFPMGDSEIVIDTGPDRRIVFSPELRESLLAIRGVEDVSLLSQNENTR
jgi:DNA polymerase III subunit alpha